MYGKEVVIIQVKKTNVTEQVVMFLREQITAGRWQPGEKIDSENKLTQELGVSRDSVRHAIQQLIAVGVLESFQGKGTFVRKLREEVLSRRMVSLYMSRDYEALMEFRSIIESASCRLAIDRMDPMQLDEMERILEQMERMLGKTEDFINADIAFHNCIIRATENQVIIDSIRNIEPEIRKQHHRFNSPETMKKALQFHRLILEAMRDKDRELAAGLMMKHLAGMEKPSNRPE